MYGARGPLTKTGSHVFARHISFSFLVKTHLSRHSVVAPFPAAPLGLHFAGLVVAATNMRQFDAAMWKSELGLGPFANVTDDIRVKLAVASKPAEEIEEEGTEGVDLYKGSFCLAYGTLTLLGVTKMHLKRYRFCGLLGPNQCGTTTLMRAIANDEGFPKQDELKSVSWSMSLRTRRLACRTTASRS